MLTFLIFLSFSNMSFAGFEENEKLFKFVSEKNISGLKDLMGKSTVSPNFTIEGNTPLIKAIEKGDGDTVKLLLENGANPNLPRTSDQLTPLYVAAYEGHEEIVDTLRGFGGDPNQAEALFGATPLFVAAERGHERIVIKLLAYGAQPNRANTRDGYGGTPLLIATAKGWNKIVELLLDGGADPNQSSSDGRGETPLHIAVEKGHNAIFHLLVEKGADLNRIRKDKSTPFNLAVKNYNNHNEEILVSIICKDLNNLYLHRATRVNWTQEMINAKDLRDTDTIGYCLDMFEHEVSVEDTRSQIEKKQVSVLTQLLRELREDPFFESSEAVKIFKQNCKLDIRGGDIDPECVFVDTAQKEVAREIAKATYVKSQKENNKSEKLRLLTLALTNAWISEESDLFNKIVHDTISSFSKLSPASHTHVDQIKFEPGYRGFVNLISWVSHLIKSRN